MIRFLSICFCGWILSACTGTGYKAPDHLQQNTVNADAFTLTQWVHPGPATDSLTIIIEGDGRAFSRTGRRSQNPTPHQPVAPALAAQIPGAIALARPCQFSDHRNPICRDKRYWSSHRWAPEVITAYHDALNRIIAKHTKKPIHLIGFSGGAAIAALLTAQRDDISRLTTLAGNLDTDAVNRLHNVPATPQSLNPINSATRLKHIPQRHISGSHDRIIPPSIAQNFIAHQGLGHCASATVLPITHNAADWIAAWPRIAAIPVTCASNAIN